MSLIWVLYLISVASNLSLAFGTAWVFGVILFGITLWGYVMTDDDPDARRTVIKLMRGAAIAVAIALPLDIAIPGKNTMYAMAAVSVGEKLADNPAVQGIASDGLKAVQAWINKQLSDAKDK